LVLGGSLGAKALNTLVSQALALMRASLSGRPEYFPLPQVIHQTGQAHIAHWQARYQEMGLSDQVNCVAFLEDVAEHMAQADLVIARAGAGTVWEIAHVGVAALFIPLPHAADDHQTRNAAFLVNQQAAWSIPQAQLSPVRLMQYLEQAQQNRHTLDDMAQRARSLAQPGAALAIASYCASYCPSLMEGTGS
jgi:UDP-N-acetylglucosamine--N-acetylmuramyl-(pentapeptide) pyrophosphoryl-undecaprenol N-acetylglucosamine transferase